MISRAETTLPPVRGLDDRFRRTLEVPGVLADAGRTRTWHHLDTADRLTDLGAVPVGTILAVHGNPTWSFHWRRIADESVRRAERGEPTWRVVAVDQLEMGFSDRTDSFRQLLGQLFNVTTDFRLKRICCFTGSTTHQPF